MTHTRWILHIDMDAFFASVEQRDNPQLRGQPVIVGGGVRGVVAAASYEARAYGVHSAMPINTARRLCPQAHIVPGRRKRYLELSHLIMEILGGFSPKVEPASIDEAYLDASGLERLFGPIDMLVPQIQQTIYSNTSLSCSIGAAPIKFLAKIASDLNKPHGYYILHHAHVTDFLRTLDVRKIPGVGKHFSEQLAAIGIKYAGQVAQYPTEFWQQRFGKAGMQLYERSRGIDPRPIATESMPKSESAETTFDTDTSDIPLLQQYLMLHAERVGANLRAQNLAGRTITVKIKFADFTQITRSKTLPHNTNTTQTIFDVACTILKATPLPQKVRLIGIAVSGFYKEISQLSLIPENTDDKKHHDLDTALDTLRQRFGNHAVVRGRLFQQK